MLPSLIFSSLWLKFKVAKISHRLTLFHALFTEYRDRRIKNDRGNYVTKQMIGAIMLLSKLDRSGGDDPLGVTLQRMLLKDL